MQDLVFTVNALSKTYAMTGWRVGYLLAPKDFQSAIANLQSHSTSNPCSIAQKAAVTALIEDQTCVKEMLSEFAKRRDYVYKAFNQIPNFQVQKIEGAFYAFVNVSKTGMNGWEMTDFLLEKAQIAVVPGGAFGKEGVDYFRFSFASSMEDIQKGIDRIKVLFN